MAFLDKPFGDEQLLEAIRSALQQDKEKKRHMTIQFRSPGGELGPPGGELWKI